MALTKPETKLKPGDLPGLGIVKVDQKETLQMYRHVNDLKKSFLVNNVEAQRILGEVSNYLVAIAKQLDVDPFSE